MICETCGYTRMTKLGQSTKIHRQHLGKTINDKFHKTVIPIFPTPMQFIITSMNYSCLIQKMEDILGNPFLLTLPNQKRFLLQSKGK